MFTIYGNKIKLTRGDTFITTLGLKKKNGEPIELTEGDTVIFAVKSKLNSKQTEYVEEEPLIMKTIPVDTMVLRLDPEDTKHLPFGSYYYDVEITFADGRVDTVINNEQFILGPEVV